ncbi:MAG: ATP-binding cassette domain-containing protein [Anaerolineae bacterium]|jgi:simple sugar transport system ATP-binding protein
MNVKPLVEMKGIRKNFGAVQALKGVDLTLHHNEVLGLVGDNAAGKSTLMKVLSGAYVADEGDILLEGEKASITKPEDSRHLGIEMVYQDFALAGNIDVAGNIFLGRERTLGGLGKLLQILNRRRMNEESRELLGRLRIEVESVRQKVNELSGGQRQAVAIGRATAFNAKVVIMDEPTASLSVAAIEKVLELIKQLKEHQVSVIIISHRLEDILTVSDRVMVLRLGRRVGDMENEGITKDDLVAYMVGARDDFPQN